MHPIVSEYRILPTNTDHLGDTEENDRKCKLIEQFDDYANEPSVSELLLELLRNRLEYDLARVEAIKVTGIFVDENCSLHKDLIAELHRIAADETEDDMLRAWAERYAK